MQATYTILESKRTDIEKLFAKYQKKAAKYNVTLTAEYGEPYAKRAGSQGRPHHGPDRHGGHGAG